MIEIGRQLLKREPGVDIIAGLAMGGALVLGETLAGVVIALMFTGGNVLEEFAQRRANRELTALLGTPTTNCRTARPATASRTSRSRPSRLGDALVVKSGEVLPVDGRLLDPAAVVDELALTGEALPVEHRLGAALRSGTVNAGGPLRLRAEADGRRQHLRGHRPSGRGSAAAEGAVRPPGQSVVVGLPRAHAR